MERIVRKCYQLDGVGEEEASLIRTPTAGCRGCPLPRFSSLSLSLSFCLSLSFSLSLYLSLSHISHHHDDLPSLYFSHRCQRQISFFMVISNSSHRWSVFLSSASHPCSRFPLIFHALSASGGQSHRSLYLSRP